MKKYSSVIVKYSNKLILTKKYKSSLNLLVIRILLNNRNKKLLFRYKSTIDHHSFVFFTLYLILLYNILNISKLYLLIN